MPSGGRVVNIGTPSRLSNTRGAAVYGATRAAQEHLAGALAAEVSLLLRFPPLSFVNSYAMMGSLGKLC
jgi:hypothetical protein